MSEPRKRVGRGIWRGVYSSLTSHPDFQVLSPKARLVFFVIRLGTQNTIASIFRYYREPLIAETGLSARALEAALVELESKPSTERPWIVRDKTVLWIRNGLAFDPTLTLANPNHFLAVRRAVAALPRVSPVVQAFLTQYGLPGGIPEGMGGRDGGIPSGITTPSTTPITNTTPVTTHGGSLSLVSKQKPEPGNGSDTPLRRAAPGEYKEVCERIRANHPELTEAQVGDEALKTLQASLRWGQE